MNQSSHRSTIHGNTWLPLSTAGAAAMLVLVGWLALPTEGLVAIVGLLVCILLGLVIAQWRRHRSATDQPSLLETPFQLAHDRPLFDRYQQLAETLLMTSRNNDLIYRDIALEHLDGLIDQARDIARGTFNFEGTETWRIVYERLLRSSGLHLYRSVAWIKNANYWQDEPGRKSMAVNFELHESERLNIERIAIVADDLWPAGEVWPVASVLDWLFEQHRRGIWVKFVLQSVLAKEPELLADIGIYGSRAVGIQQLDEQCRTVRFTLAFDFDQVTAAEERWNRLSIYAESLADYLDRYELPG